MLSCLRAARRRARRSALLAARAARSCRSCSALLAACSSRSRAAALSPGRIAHGRSVEELAWEAGIAPRTLQRLESGTHMPATRTVIAVADALGVTVQTLIVHEDEEAALGVSRGSPTWRTTATPKVSSISAASPVHLSGTPAMQPLSWESTPQFSSCQWATDPPGAHLYGAELQLCREWLVRYGARNVRADGAVVLSALPNAGGDWLSLDGIDFRAA